jgi:putative transposase
VRNKFGRILEEEWDQTAALRDNVKLDEFVVMPDHFHGMIWLTGRGAARRAPASATGVPATIESFGSPVAGSIPTIVRAFKSAVTRRVNEVRSSPGARVWQRGYYEHVIRGEDGLLRLRGYIRSNAECLLDSPNAH